MKKLDLHILASLLIMGAGFQTAAAQEDEALVFGYSGDVAIGLGTSDKSITKVAGAIEIPAELSKAWVGANLTGVNIGYGYSTEKIVTVFLTEALDKEPFYTQEAVVTNQGGWNKVTFDVPQKITGEDFYVGYSVPYSATTQKPIGIDNIKTDNPYSAFVNTYDEWEDIGKFYGSVCLRIVMEGDNLPQNSIEATNLQLPGLVELSKPFAASMEVYNDGVKTVQDLTVKCLINGEEVSGTVVTLLEGPIPSGEHGTVEISNIVCPQTGKELKVEIEVTEVNGEEDESYIDNNVSGSINCAAKTFYQQMLVEEFTGTWCGYCPIGLVGMAYMKEHYGNQGFNGIAVHNGDDMTVPSYSSFATTYSQGSYPSALINRSIYFLEPSSEVMEAYFKEVTKYPSIAGVELEAQYVEQENVVKVKSLSEFSFDEENANYAMAYVIVEDNVGPYTQTNYFAGGANGGLEGWSNKPTKAENTYYNEVARIIKTTYGIEGSIPSAVKASTEYEYQTELSCEEVENIEECEVIALLIDKNTGVVVNSTKASIENSNTGIQGIESDSESGRISVYNLQGVKVLETMNSQDLNTLSKGIYIINGKKYKL